MLSLLSCKKGFEESKNGADTFNTILKESGESDLISQINRLEAMGEDERRAKEISINFKSLLTYVYTRYEQINVDSLADLSNLISFIQNNSDLIELKQDNDGEFICRPIYSDNPYSLIADTSRMIVIRNFCIKIFDDGIISTTGVHCIDLEAESAILTVEANINQYYNVVTFPEVDNLRNNCGRHIITRTTSGRYRTRTTLITHATLTGGVLPAGRVMFSVRPFKRTLGVWFCNRRTIDAYADFDFTYFEGSGPSITGAPGNEIDITINRAELFTTTNGYFIGKTFQIPTLNSHFPYNLRLSRINSYGHTSKTGHAFIICE
ncbi:MAG: hypothetical protein ACXITV_10165 [Luteibaculaceae bacterium]